MTGMGEILPDERYGGVAVGLHWLLAVLIVATFALGLYMTGLPLSVGRVKLYSWHKWIGVMILALSAVRLLWRLSHRVPPLPTSPGDEMIRRQNAVHRGTHLLLYVLFFAVPLSGWAYTASAGFPVVLFGVLPLPDLVAVDREAADSLFKPLHHGAAFALAATVLLHSAAALFHHFARGGSFLQRMWPRPPRG